MIQYLRALLGCNHYPERFSITISSAYPLKPRRASNISLIWLDKKAINEHQPLITELGISPAILDYSDSNVEIIIKEH